jgi:tRNA-(ms[2]io[6]A)-hydroxylase
MIEARSCERFRVLSKNIKDEELAKFYHDLMVSEATHYTTFLNFARKYAEDVDVENAGQNGWNTKAKSFRVTGKVKRYMGNDMKMYWLVRFLILF